MAHILQSFGILKKLTALINLSLKQTWAKVLVGGKLSEEFKVSTGVRQEDSVSTVLFNCRSMILSKI